MSESDWQKSQREALTRVTPADAAAARGLIYEAFWPTFHRLDPENAGPVQINPANVAFVQDDDSEGSIIFTSASAPHGGVWVRETRAQVLLALGEAVEYYPSAMQKPGRAHEL